MARPFKKVRDLMHEYELTVADLSREMGISSVTVSNRLNARHPWTLDEMYKFLELTDQPASRMHEIFPKDGINEPGVKRKLYRRPA